MAVLDKLLGNLDSLSDSELDELLSRIEVAKSGRRKEADTLGLTVEDGTIIACPHCASATNVKCGKKNGVQRYRCKDCGRYYTKETNTLLHYSHLNREQWIELLRGIVENLSLQKIADNVGISVKAAWYNKQKVLSILSEKFSKQDKFDGITECDEHSVHMSFKGKRDPAFFIKVLKRMPRHHRNRAEKIEYLKKAGLWEELQADKEFLEELLYGKDTFLPGTNKDSVCILSGKDRAGNLFAKAVCLGSIETYHVSKHLDGRIDTDDILVTDGSNVYTFFAQERNIEHVRVISSKHAVGPYSLSRVNSLHSNIDKHWPESRQNLPATKYLDLGLMLFWWLEKNKALTTKQQVDTLYRLITETSDDLLTYDKLLHRPLDLDTKGLIPVRV